MQREDLLDAVEHARRDGIERTARLDLLGRLEDQPDPVAELTAGRERAEHEADAENDGRVHVVPAGVGDP